jgi:hypothetical protein
MRRDRQRSFARWFVVPLLFMAFALLYVIADIRPRVNHRRTTTMNATHLLQNEITLDLCVWVLLVIALIASATWQSRAAPRANARPSSEQITVAESVCGPPVATSALSQPASSISRTPVPSKPPVAARPRKSIPEEVAVTGPYEFYEWL